MTVRELAESISTSFVAKHLEHEKEAFEVYLRFDDSGLEVQVLPEDAEHFGMQEVAEVLRSPIVLGCVTGFLTSFLASVVHSKITHVDISVLKEELEAQHARALALVAELSSASKDQVLAREALAFALEELKKLKCHKSDSTGA